MSFKFRLGRRNSKVNGVKGMILGIVFVLAGIALAIFSKSFTPLILIPIGIIAFLFGLNLFSKSPHII